MEWDDGLDDNARRIAACRESPLMVVAGPGTGKTFALIRRTGRLLQEGAAPESIFACSFTRTAANDLCIELSRLAMPGASRVHSSTLHSFCFRLLGRAEVLQITGRVPRPLMKFEERFLLEDLKGSQFGGVRECGKMLEAFNAAWGRLQSDEPGWPSDERDREFQIQLLQWLKFHKAMLIGELIPEALRFLRENPASAIRPHFAHVLVDEYQDLNRAEQTLLDILASKGTLTVVGDEDQSIYSFKYAHPEGISTFDQSHPDATSETLEVCRRCPTAVVEIANELIGNNPTRAARRLVPASDAPVGEIHLVQWDNLEAEVDGIAGFVDHRVKNGQVEAGRVLILTPRRHLGYRIRDKLNELGTRAHSFFQEQSLDGNPNELDTCKAQQAFSLLTLLADPEDRVALRCWCGFGSDSLRKNTWGRLRLHCEESGESPMQALERVLAGQLNRPQISDVVLRYSQSRQLLTMLADLRGKSLLDAIFPAEEAWAEPFRLIGSSLGDDQYDARSLLEEIRTSIVQPELPTEVDYVRIMSLHKSKGLTADLVVVVGCIEGLIPFIDDLPSHDLERSIQEQRRLFYVAITRTRHTLVISSAAKLPRSLAYRMRVPVKGRGRDVSNTIASRFVTELGPRRPRTIRGDLFLQQVGVTRYA